MVKTSFSNKDHDGVSRGRLVTQQNVIGSFNFSLNKKDLHCEKYVYQPNETTCKHCNKGAAEHLDLWIPKSLHSASETTLSVSFHALRRSKESLCDFMNSYFSYHDLIPSVDFLYILGTLYFVEAAIYQLDEENEEAISSGKKLSESTLDILVNILKQQEIFDDLIENELKLGNDYWNLERMLCSCPHRQISLELADRAIKNKSFDYRILNLVLYKIKGKGRKLTQTELDLLDFLRTYEVLIEIRDDLVDYDEDVTKNSFNIYRMFVKLYGPKTASSELLKYIKNLEHNYNTKLAKLPSHLQEKHMQHFRTSKGGMWIWDPPSAIPEEEPQPKPAVTVAFESSIPKGKKLNAEDIRMLFFSSTPPPVAVPVTSQSSEVPESSKIIDKRNLVSFRNIFNGVKHLESFLDSYFKMYNIPYSSILQYIDVLEWVESQLSQQFLHQNSLSSTSAVWVGIEEFLTHHKLMSTEVSKEIDLGRNMFTLETQILQIQSSKGFLSEEDKMLVTKWLHSKSFHERLLHKLLWSLDPQFCIMTHVPPHFTKPSKSPDYKEKLLDFVTSFEAIGELLSRLLQGAESKLGFFENVGEEVLVELEIDYKKALSDLLPQHQQGHKDVLKALFGRTEWNWKEFLATK